MCKWSKDWRVTIDSCRVSNNLQMVSIARLKYIEEKELELLLDGWTSCGGGKKAHIEKEREKVQTTKV